MPIRLAVLLSGSGTTLQNIIDRIDRGELDATVAGVVSSRAGVFGLERAKKHGIPTAEVVRNEYSSHGAFNEALWTAIRGFSPDLVVLAGFMSLIDVPADWEETRMVNGALGEYVTLARKARKARSGDDWFVGSMTDDKKRDLELPLKFLSKHKTYVAEMYRDAEDADWKTNPFAHKIERQLVTRDSILPLHLAAGGGEAIRFKPATEKEKSELKK